MPVFPKYDEPRMPESDPREQIEADRRARYEENMRRQREEEAYYFKMRNAQNPGGSYGDTPEDFGYNPIDFSQRSNPPPRKSNDIINVIKATLNSGNASLQEQQKLMALLEAIKGK
jgi:hypothetical protein